MEESKAAAYYNELTRKGEGAARFKQGLGFTSGSGSGSDTVPARGSALLSSSSSFLSSFVKASSPAKSSQLEKEAHLSSIQNKLKKKPRIEYGDDSRVSERDSETRRNRSRSRERDRVRYSRRRSRDREAKNHSRSRRSKDRDRSRSRDRDRDVKRHSRRRSRERSHSPRHRSVRGGGGERDVAVKDKIEGYDKMTPAERVKAKMKFQLAETSQKDSSIGMGSGWERFEFDKDAPLDDEEIEAADDDASVLKHVAQSFRFSAIEQRREEKIKAAHDDAMFGASPFQPSLTEDSKPEVENDKTESHISTLDTSLLSEKVLAKQQGSWRDRARKT